MISREQVPSSPEFPMDVEQELLKIEILALECYVRTYERLAKEDLLHTRKAVSQLLTFAIRHCGFTYDEIASGKVDRSTVHRWASGRSTPPGIGGESVLGSVKEKIRTRLGEIKSKMEYGM